MRCSNCGAQLHENARFCARCGARVLAQKTAAGSQNTNNNRRGVSDPGTVSFDEPGQNQGMEQHAGSRTVQNGAAYSSMRENPENTVGDEYTMAYGNTSQGSMKNGGRGGYEYTAAYGNASQEPMKNGGRDDDEYTMAYGNTSQGSMKNSGRGGYEYTAAYGNTSQGPMKNGGRDDDEYTMAYGNTSQGSMKNSGRGGYEYTATYGNTSQGPMMNSGRDDNEYTMAYGNTSQGPVEYSDQDRQTSSTIKDNQNFDDLRTTSFGSTGADIYTENISRTAPDSEPGRGFSQASGNPYIYQGSAPGDEENTKPKSRLSILIAGEILAILAVGAILVFLLFGKFDPVVNPTDSTETESQTVGSESRTSSADSKTDVPVTVTPTPVPTNTPTPTPTATPTVPTSAPVPTTVPTPTPMPPSTPVPQPSVETISCYNGVQAPADEFVFPYSSQRYLTQAELNSLLGDRDYMHMQSQLAINEIFARYGYTFVKDTATAQDARNHFEGRSWYVTLQGMCPTNNSDDLKNYYMNAYEQANIKMLNEWQMANDVYY